MPHRLGLRLVRISYSDLRAGTKGTRWRESLAAHCVDERALADFFAAEQADEIRLLGIGFNGCGMENWRVFLKQRWGRGAGEFDDFGDELVEFCGHNLLPSPGTPGEG